GDGCACSSCCGAAGSQVDFTSGSYEFTETDLTLPAVGMPIVLSRTYRSNTHAPFARVLGAQRPLSYDAQLRFEVGGDVTYVDEGLREWRFTTNGAGGWNRPPAYHAELAEIMDGYRITEKGGTFRDFDEDGKLVGVEDLSGNRVSVT